MFWIYVIEKEAISNSNSVEIKSRRNVEVTVNANKLRSFANVLPEDMPTDQYLFLISDVMKEIERTGRINLDSVSIEHLKKGWKQFKVTEEQIYRILRIIDKY